MPQYFSPGVYVEEVDSGTKPIEGVSTSNAGFVGVTQRGPASGVPVLVTSFPEFRRTFGGYLDSSWGDSRFLAYAVQGFFENGGQIAYIKRVPGAGAAPSSAILHDGIVTRLQEDVTAPFTSARLASTGGISNGSSVALSSVIGGVVVSEPVTVTSYDPNTGLIQWAGAVSPGHSKANTAVIIRAPAAPPLFTLQARDPGMWGGDLSVLPEYRVPARSDMVPGIVVPMLAMAAAPVFAGAGPGLNALNVILNAGHGLQTDDVVEFIHGGIKERRPITVAVNTISWTEPLHNDFSSGSSVRLVTAVRKTGTQVALSAPLTTDLAPGDTLHVSGASGTGEDVLIAGAWVPGSSPLVVNAPGFQANYLEGDTLALTSVAARIGATHLRLRSARNFYPGALVELDNGTDRETFVVNSINGNDLTLSGPTTKAYQVGNWARLLEFRLTVRYRNDAEHINQTETFDGLSLNPAVTDKYVLTQVNAHSNLITLPMPLSAPGPLASLSTADGSWLAFSGGSDGTPPLDADFIGVDNGPGERTGIQALIDLDNISIVAVPGKTSQAIQTELIALCENMLDRFAVLDSPLGSTVQTVQDFRNRYDTKYAALYYPWVQVFDPLVNDTIYVPPSGQMVGIYARVDTERGVHKAPANEVLRGILDLEVLINKREQDVLNPEPVNINVLRDFRHQGRGLRVWGARCLTSDTDWKYINVRRLFIFLEKSLEEGTQWVVFEPNDERLWARVRQSVSNFLTRVWRDGALMGTKPEEAFYVRCDRTTMTQDDLDNGRLILLIGVAPVYPAEFVIIRIGQWVGGSSVDEG